MNCSPRILLQLAGLLLTGGALLAADNTISVIAVSDITGEGRGTRQATPADPVYYLPHTTGFTTSGATIDGVTAPPKPKVEVMLVKALASQGYIYHKLAHKPASILLIFEWGYMAPQVDPEGKVQNKEEMISLVEGLTPIDPSDGSLRVQNVLAAAKVPRFYLTITAMDFNPTPQKKYTALWCTRASTEVEGAPLDQVLPALLQAITPILGTQTSAPRVVEESLAAGN